MGDQESREYDDRVEAYHQRGRHNPQPMTLTTDREFTLLDDCDNEMAKIKIAITFRAYPEERQTDVDPGSPAYAEFIRASSRDPRFDAASWQCQIAEAWVQRNQDACLEIYEEALPA